MKKILVVLALMVSGALGAGNNLQPMNVKVGLWQTDETVTISGQPPIPADQFAKMSPDQRAKTEAAMKALAGTRTFTFKSCVTKEKLEEGKPFDKDNCSWTALSSTSSTLSVRGVCTEENVKINLNLQFVAINTENVTGSGQMSMSGGGRTMSSATIATSKWVGSNCGSVK